MGNILCPLLAQVIVTICRNDAVWNEVCGDIVLSVSVHCRVCVRIQSLTLRSCWLLPMSWHRLASVIRRRSSAKLTGLRNAWMASCCVSNASATFSTCLLHFLHTSKRFIFVSLLMCVTTGICDLFAYDWFLFLAFPFFVKLNCARAWHRDIGARSCLSVRPSIHHMLVLT